VPKGKLRKRVPPPPPPEEEPTFTPDEMAGMVYKTIKHGEIYRLKAFLSTLDSEDLYISGSVTRDRSHYVHERTTSFNMEIDWYGATKNGAELTDQEQTKGEELEVAAAEAIGELIVDINYAIYKSLEMEYEHMMADEQADETIRANEYDFDEDGHRGGEFTIDQLDDRAKENARSWWREGAADYEWWDFIYEDWKEWLERAGFSGPDISFSGFSSQGDGASFTANSFDFNKFVEMLSSEEWKERKI
jgi:hypothetical protein